MISSLLVGAAMGVNHLSGVEAKGVPQEVTMPMEAGMPSVSLIDMQNTPERIALIKGTLRRDGEQLIKQYENELPRVPMHSFTVNDEDRNLKIIFPGDIISIHNLKENPNSSEISGYVAEKIYGADNTKVMKFEVNFSKDSPLSYNQKGELAWKGKNINKISDKGFLKILNKEVAVSVGSQKDTKRPAVEGNLFTFLC